MADQFSTQRDTRIDVFRALALLTIFVNHVPGTLFEHLTHKNSRLLGLRGSLRADLRHRFRSGLWRQVRAGQPAPDDAQGVAAGRRALHHPHHDDGGDAGHLLGRGAGLRTARPAQADQHRADHQRHAGGAGRHRHARPSGRLQQHPVDVCGGAGDDAVLHADRPGQPEADGDRLGRGVARRRRAADRAAQLPRRGGAGSSIRSPGSSCSSSVWRG